MTDTSSKVAIVTGASGGIGAEIAHRLARDGFTVVVNYAGNPAPAKALVAKIQNAGGRAVAAQADIADPAAVARLSGEARPMVLTRDWKRIGVRLLGKRAVSALDTGRAAIRAQIGSAVSD